MASHQHDVLVPVSVKQRLMKERFKRETSGSSIVADIIRDYAAGNGAEVYQPKPEERAIVRFRVEDDVWAAALERAARDGTNLSDVARIKLDVILTAPAG